MGYKVGNLPDVNQPVNILEEIVWYKAKEIEAFRDKQPLPLLQVCHRGCGGGRVGWGEGGRGGRGGGARGGRALQGVQIS
jgi:hypothetical protein